MDTVLPGWFAHVTRLRVTLCYAVLVAGVTALMMRMTPGVQEALIRHSSTNLHNLGHGRFETLVGSAFVVDAGPIYLWLPGLVCLLALAELAWGSSRLLVAAVAGHVGASLIVAAGLAAAVKLGWMGGSVAHEPDVGMSYIAMAVLGALTGALPSRWRLAWTGWWFGVSMVVVAGGPDFTDIGHIVALTLGMLLSLRFGTARRWSVPMVLLLAFGAAFSYLVLTDGLVTLVFGAAWGALAALTFGSFGRLRTVGDKRKGASLPEAPYRFRVTSR